MQCRMYVRVRAGIDPDDDAGEVDERERVDGGLDGREVPGGGVLVDDERARGQERAVQRPVVAAVAEATHEAHPPCELPLDRLHPRRVHRVRQRLRGRRRALPGPQPPRVRAVSPLPVPRGGCLPRRHEQRHGDDEAEEEPRPRRHGHGLVVARWRWPVACGHRGASCLQ